MAQQLSKAAIDAIQSDPDLYAQVCKKMKVKPVSLPKIIQRKSERLTLYGVVNVIIRKTGLKASEIIEERI